MKMPVPYPNVTLPIKLCSLVEDIIHKTVDKTVVNADQNHKESGNTDFKEWQFGKQFMRHR